MNKRMIIGIMAVLAILTLSGYLYLGGLNSIEYTVEEVTGYTLAGTPFTGKRDSKQIEEAFFEARDYLDRGEVSGVLTIVHYQDTTLAAGDEVRLFIGIKLDDDDSYVPEHYQRLIMPAKSTLRAVIEAHNWVMPRPRTIEANLDKRAEQYGMVLQPFTIEQYVSARKLIIDRPEK